MLPPIIDMYIKCGGLKFVEQVFLRFRVPSLEQYDYGYLKDMVLKALLIRFPKCLNVTTVSWNKMISILAQHGFSLLGSELLVCMLRCGINVSDPIP